MTNTNKTIEVRMNELLKAGVNTANFNLELNGVTVNVTLDVPVQDKQVNNGVFRRWIMAQTFKMLYEPSYVYDKWRGKMVKQIGWDNYLRNNYDYEYQFKMLLDEVKTLSKLEQNDQEEFKERLNFFNKGVVVNTCWDYTYKLERYIEANKYTTTNSKKENGSVITVETPWIKLAKYGTITVHQSEDIVRGFKSVIMAMDRVNNYKDLYLLLKQFVKAMNRLPKNTAKCAEWKDAFKGSGAYYTLKNMILFHDCVLPYCQNKKESLEKLTRCLSKYRGEGWRFHAMLKATIDWNHFDLKESIENHK